MKIHERTPDPAVYFLAGSLPAEGFLHLRQLSLFGMVCHLEDNILKDLAIKLLESPLPSMKSVFLQIRDLCNLYHLPDALYLLRNPLPKNKFKSLCRSNVYEFWHNNLTSETSALSSLMYLRPSYLSLMRPHPIWTSLNSNPYESKAARIQALFHTGRYRTEKLCRFWSSNSNGYCLQDTCLPLNIVEDLTHLLVHCPALNETRRRLSSFSYTLLSDMPLLGPILDAYLFNSDNDDLTVQFLVDCSVLPLVISCRQLLGNAVLEKLFKLTRTWCYSLHKSRCKGLGRPIS